MDKFQISTCNDLLCHRCIHITNVISKYTFETTGNTSTCRIHTLFYCIHMPYPYIILLHPHAIYIHCFTTYRIHTLFYRIHIPYPYIVLPHPHTISIHCFTASTCHIHTLFYCIHMLYPYIVLPHPHAISIHVESLLNSVSTICYCTTVVANGTCSVTSLTTD